VKNTFLNKLYSVNGLLLTAFLFFSLSFIFNKIYTEKTSLSRETSLLQDYVDKYRNKFDDFVKDTQLVRGLLTYDVSKKEIEKLSDDKLGIYLFYEDEYGNYESKFWITSWHFRNS
jgi:hypothetical protein